MPVKMEFGLLGPLIVRSGGTDLLVPRGRQRSLLAMLLLHANHVVSADAVTEILWQTNPPPSAPVSIRNYMARLRQILGTAEPQRIVTHPRGDFVRASGDELDLSRRTAAQFPVHAGYTADPPKVNANAASKIRRGFAAH